MPTPKATVAIPVFNSEATLERCLASASAQTLANIEIIVADDGSTDGSAALAEALAGRDPRIRVVRMERNGGKSRAMNHILTIATGEWFAVLDADDTYHRERLERLIREAEAHEVELAADNIAYIDDGVQQVVQTGFDPGQPSRLITKQDLAAHSNSFGSFDFGILKPVIQRRFLLAHHLTYYEDTKLAEDFYYLMNFFAAGGRGWLVAAPLYNWTMPFGAISRRWTATGSGAWRYDYRQALRANAHFIEQMRQRGEPAFVAMLEARARQYRAMIPYLDAQRLASERRWAQALLMIVRHPATYRLLVTRIAGRIRRRRRGPAQPSLTVPGSAAP